MGISGTVRHVCGLVCVVMLACTDGDSKLGTVDSGGCDQQSFEEQFLAHCAQTPLGECTGACRPIVAVASEAYCSPGAPMPQDTVGCQPVGGICTLGEVFARDPTSGKVYHFTNGCTPFGWALVSPPPCPSR
jgi:hypothetical protein